VPVYEIGGGGEKAVIHAQVIIDTEQFEVFLGKDIV